MIARTSVLLTDQLAPAHPIRSTGIPRKPSVLASEILINAAYHFHLIATAKPYDTVTHFPNHTLAACFAYWNRASRARAVCCLSRAHSDGAHSARSIRFASWACCGAFAQWRPARARTPRARSTTGKSTMSPSCRNAPVPWVRASSAACSSLIARSISSYLGEKTSFAIVT